MSRQYFVPGQGYINETATSSRQYFVPGWGYINETVSFVTLVIGKMGSVIFRQWR